MSANTKTDGEEAPILTMGFPSEVHPIEKRFALTPETVIKMKKMGFNLIMQKGGGVSAEYYDNEYVEVGVTIMETAEEVWAKSDIIVKVQPPSPEEVKLVKPNHVIISYIFPGRNEELVERLKETNATVLSMDMVPRISRAQKLDSLSSMAKVAGYRSVIESLNYFGKFVQQEITAAGTIKPAKFLVIGGGVAGLAALGCAHKLGAVVEVFDTRPVVKEQVESMGGTFLEVDIEEDGSGSGGYAKVMSKAFIEAEMALFAAKAKEVDVIITTAAIPGKAAPVLITKAMVESMKPGSVIVDLAAAQGGNCEVTEVEKIIKHKGVTVIGHRDMPNRMPKIASSLYSQNVVALLGDMGGCKKWNINLEDVVVRGMLVVQNGVMMYPPPPVHIPDAAPTQKTPEKTPEEVEAEEKENERQALIFRVSWQGTILAILFLLALWGTVSEQIGTSLLPHILVFALACVAGWTLIWNVADALRTPLMSVTNAVSGIVVLGGMIQLNPGVNSTMTIFLSSLATLVATINFVGGFWVTQRMLQMFRKFNK